MLGGPNLEAQRAMRQSVGLPVIASGGITTVDDIKALGTIPVAGCIIGRALYEGKLKLGDALAASRAILAGG